MPSLAPHGVLAAAELAFFTPSFLLALYICHRHSFRQCRTAGWFYLLLLHTLRLIGASCTLYAEPQHPTQGVLITAAITSAIGTAPLFLVLLGFLKRLNILLTAHNLPTRIFTPIHIPSLAALILAIVGINLLYDTSSSSPTHATGRALFETSTLIFLVIYLALALILAHTTYRLPHVPTSERILVFAGLAVLPFMSVRIVYVVCVGFASPGSTFDSADPDAWIQAFMQFAMEAACVVLYIWAGVASPRQEAVDKEGKRERQGEKGMEEMGSTETGSTETGSTETGRVYESKGKYGQRY
ncbi:hypothetical protein TI39_contig296g00006 [Zymoseptoria brevis]|uniref:DUF7702 domain-containing protein n=1 Tax=Zymoseptoria brevis TaxID=1047168 RepID=A0A0F4GVR4_9PEZI|nr:hypothetical protein TI39_contig296g00006 [Zymoseptoria brevis]